MYVAFYRLLTTRPHRTHAPRAKTRRSIGADNERRSSVSLSVGYRCQNGGTNHVAVSGVNPSRPCWQRRILWEISSSRGRGIFRGICRWHIAQYRKLMQRERVAELVKCQQAASVTHVWMTLGVVDQSTRSWRFLGSVDPHRRTLHTHTHTPQSISTLADRIYSVVFL